ncbi:MAG: DUF2304 domain-containing protein, partial [Actinomycetota bacterium]
MTRIVLVGIATSAAFIVAILALIRTRRLQERFAILWILTGIGVVVLGLWTNGLEAIARLVGIAYPPSALFALVSGFVVLVLLHTAVILSRLSNQNQNLAQRIALLDERLRRLEDDRDGEDGDGAAAQTTLRRAPRPLGAPAR